MANNKNNPLALPLNAASGAYCDTRQDYSLARAHRIINTLFAGRLGGVAIELWDGSLFLDQQSTECRLKIHHPGVLRDLILRRDLIRLAQAFIKGQIDIEGDIAALFQLERVVTALQPTLRESLQLLFDAWKLPSLPRLEATDNHRAGIDQQRNSRKAIAHHYDVGNEFYQLWLDKNMVYSCAYFKSATQSLDQAQQDKLDYLCRKLRLQPGQTLLDIGCGWGALAIWAAQHYGVKVRGITLSQQQFDFARQRVEQGGLNDSIQIDLLDYRDLTEEFRYDRIVSVGMFEHIGVANFAQYFGKIKRLLKPGGLFLNHGITIKQNLRRSPLKRFINQYIFPDGELTRISDVNSAMEQAGFEIIDVESLRRHYALTLHRWVAALERNAAKAIAASSTETYRLWRLYMSGFAWYFDEGTVNLHQILVAHQHDALTLPLRRDDLYSAKPAHSPQTQGNIPAGVHHE